MTSFCVFHKGEGVPKRAKTAVILKESPKASGMKEYLSLRYSKTINKPFRQMGGESVILVNEAKACTKSNYSTKSTSFNQPVYE